MQPIFAQFYWFSFFRSFLRTREVIVLARYCIDRLAMFAWMECATLRPQILSKNNTHNPRTAVYDRPGSSCLSALSGNGYLKVRTANVTKLLSTVLRLLWECHKTLNCGSTVKKKKSRKVSSFQASSVPAWSRRIIHAWHLTSLSCMHEKWFFIFIVAFCSSKQQPAAAAARRLCFTFLNN